MCATKKQTDALLV